MIKTAAILAAGDPGVTIQKVTGWGILLVTLVFVFIAVKAALRAGKGDVRGTANMAGASLLVLIPLGIAMGVGVVAFADDILAWLGW